ncbi:hypothetical protein Glove_86g121 [Diversispora epigaea]|uniref:Uncharacterized protein n=1 Tax=Diversispora epigaea TaxID=1348612 RepID=A0A397JAF0_9GLOM|nr:hypothetical protein Glove_86g121 [Diversispora epigaea]
MKNEVGGKKANERIYDFIIAQLGNKRNTSQKQTQEQKKSIETEVSILDAEASSLCETIPNYMTHISNSSDVDETSEEVKSLPETEVSNSSSSEPSRENDQDSDLSEAEIPIRVGTVGHGTWDIGIVKKPRDIQNVQYCIWVSNSSSSEPSRENDQDSDLSEAEMFF